MISKKQTLNNWFSLFQCLRGSHLSMLYFQTFTQVRHFLESAISAYCIELFIQDPSSWSLYQTLHLPVQTSLTIHLYIVLNSASVYPFIRLSIHPLSCWLCTLDRCGWKVTDAYQERVNPPLPKNWTIINHWLWSRFEMSFLFLRERSTFSPSAIRTRILWSQSTFLSNIRDRMIQVWLSVLSLRLLNSPRIYID